MARNRDRKKQDNDGFDYKLLKVRRVSRMYHGGRRMRFSTFIVLGNKEGKVAVASSKANDIPSAQQKAVNKAKKRLVEVNLKGNTIPHGIEYTYKSSKVILRPAAPGTGIVAGATVKAVAELAGVKDLLTKVIGSTNPINTATAAVLALNSLKKVKVDKSSEPKAKSAKKDEEVVVEEKKQPKADKKPAKKVKKETKSEK